MNDTAAASAEAWPVLSWILGSVGVAIGIAFTLALAERLSESKWHPREPACIRPVIPWVGHLLGIWLWGARYIKTLG